MPADPGQDAKIGFPPDVNIFSPGLIVAQSSTMFFRITGLRLTLAEVVSKDPEGYIES